MQRTPHSASARSKKKQETPRNKKLANAAIIGVGALVVAGLGVAAVQDQRAEAQNAERVDTYTPAVVPTRGPSPDRVAVIGDSYTSGSDMGGLQAENWTRTIRPMVSTKDHPVEIAAKGLGGAGHLHNGPDDTNFMDAAEDVVTPGTEVVVVFGSRNDLQTVGEVHDAAVDLYEFIEKTAPKAQLVVVGLPIPYDEPTPEDEAVAGEIRSAAEDHADFYVDPMGEGWFDDGRLIGKDEVHPTDEGHTLIAERIAPALRDALEAARKAEAKP